MIVLISLEQLVERPATMRPRTVSISHSAVYLQGVLGGPGADRHGQPYRIERESVRYKCGWTPLEGIGCARVFFTIVNGGRLP